MTRSQLALLGLLVVQVVLIVVTRGPLARPQGGAEAASLLPALAAAAPARIEIHGAEGKEVTLVREGSRWGIAQADGYPADSSKVAGLIRTLEEVKVRRPVVRSSRYHGALKVSDKEHERRVRIWSEPRGKPLTGIYLGTSPNYRITHVRREGDDRVYEVSGLGVHDVEQERSGWIQSRLADLESEAVTAIRVENAHGRFEAEKGADGKWRLAGAAGQGGALDATKVGDLVRAATSLYLSDPAGALDRARQGFEPPAASVTLRAGEEDVTVLVGGKVPDQEGKRHVTRAGFGYAAMIHESAVEKLLGQKAAALK